MTKTLLSGIKSTGQLHIGNFFGAMKQFVEAQNEYDSYVFIADLHSLTTVHDPVKMQKSTFDLAAAYLAIGLDPEQVTLFKQSDVPSVTELAWIFNCITTMPYLMRAHAFKDAEAKNKDINVGVFDYPILMAADILIYNANVVPVGKDQKQHIEIARDIAEKFNAVFGKTFNIPEEKILADTETIIGTDGRKMSKSYGNVIPLFGTTKEISEAVMSIKTSSKKLGESLDPDGDTVFALHKLVSTDEEIKDLENSYKKGDIGYGHSKKLLTERLLQYFAPARERYNDLQKNPETVNEVLRQGAERANSRALQKMEEVRKRVGIRTAR